MKTYFYALLMILAVLTISMPSQAQEEPGNDISVSYGIATTDDFLFVFADIFTDIVGYETQNSTYTGAINLSYKHELSELFWLGGTVVYEGSKSDVFIFGENTGTQDQSIYTVALEGNIQYLHTPVFKLYSGLGFGYTFLNSTYHPKSGADQVSNNGHFNFQVTAIGFRVGKAFSGFAEAGLGYKGLVNAGISYRF